RHLVIFGDQGYAQIAVSNLSRETPVVLQAWAKVSGKLMIGDKPGSNQEVVLGAYYWGYPYNTNYMSIIGGTLRLHSTVKTDEVGEFEFAHVPAGEWLLAHLYHASIPSPPQAGRDARAGRGLAGLPGDPREAPGGLTQTTPVRLKHGESVAIQLGGV